jgi:aldose 1-epimerase
VFDRPWRVVEQEPDRVVGEFHAARDDASLLELWPADFRIRAAYALRNATLSCQIDVHNPDQKPLPCGLGTHPYFRLPVGGKSADACVVTLPVTAEWELTDLLPTGRRLPLAKADRFQSGMSFRDMQFDNAFSGLQVSACRHRATIEDPESRVRVGQDWDAAFRECVVYTPPHRSAICIEPLTCVPCAMELTARGVDAGLKIIPPGDGFSATVNINVS